MSENSVDSFVKSPEHLRRPEPKDKQPNKEVMDKEVDLRRQRKDQLSAELADLQTQVARLRDEQRVLMSRNKQLNDMNSELERQTLEKFGPNSLWGSLNRQQESPSPTRGGGGGSSSSGGLGSGPGSGSAVPTSGASSEAPLVTRLDEPHIEAPPAQAQFLPLKTAKQWFLRRPGKPSAQRKANGTTGMGPSSSNTNPAQPPVGPLGSLSTNHSGSSKASLLGDSLQNRTHIDQAPVPAFVTRCFAEIEKRGLDTEGIYRKPGSKSQIDAILEQFGPTGDPKVGEELLGGEIQAVSSAVKQYLRGLSIPVISYDAYEAFIAAGNSQNSEMLRQAVQSLSPEHLATLRAVVSHLTLVVEHEDSNLMNVRNLAMVFAPTLAHDEFGDREIPDMQARNEATQMLINHPEIVLEPFDELS